MGHRSIKCSLFSSHHSTVGDVNDAFHSLAHTILLSLAASLNRFFLITLLFEKSRANQARRISSPTRTLIAVIFLLSLFFFANFRQLPGSAVTPWLMPAVHTAWVLQGTFCVEPARARFLYWLIRFDRNSTGFKWYFTVNMWAETAAPKLGLPGGLDGVLGVYGPREKNFSSSSRSYVISSI